MDGSGLVGGGGGCCCTRKASMKELLVRRFMVCPCDSAKLQGPSGNEVVVLCVDVNGLGVMRG